MCDLGGVSCVRKHDQWVCPARHLAWLEEALGRRFAAGVVFHTGPRPVPYSAGIVGLPISALWSVAVMRRVGVEE
jgi:hypothetical protein